MVRNMTRTGLYSERRRKWCGTKHAVISGGIH